MNLTQRLQEAHKEGLVRLNEVKKANLSPRTLLVTIANHYMPEEAKIEGVPAPPTNMERTFPCIAYVNGFYKGMKN